MPPSPVPEYPEAHQKAIVAAALVAKAPAKTVEAKGRKDRKKKRKRCASVICPAQGNATLEGSIEAQVPLAIVT